MPRWLPRLFRRPAPAPPPAPPPARPPDDGVPTLLDPVRELTVALRKNLDAATVTYVGTVPDADRPPEPEGPKPPPGYRLVRHLGAGTYGTVFLAEDVQVPGLRVAIKFFAHGPGAQWKLLQDEVRRLAALDGVSGIVQIKQVAADARPPYFIMSFAEGGSLAGRLDRGPLPVPDAVRLVKKVADALAVVHAKGIIHCDLKPGNVLLDAAGNPLVADFGLAQLATEAGGGVGTFFYMAPEQADLDGALPDTRWDVHALGALLYALVVGRPPRLDSRLPDDLASAKRVSEQFRVYRAVVPTLPPPDGHRHVAGVDAALARIIDRCLAADPEARYRDAAAVAAALRERDHARHRRPLLAVAAVATAALVVLTVLGGLQVTRTALTRTDALLAAQDRSDNVITARLVADLLRAELHVRVDRLGDLADDPRVRAAVALAARRITAGATASPFGPEGTPAARAELDAMISARGAAELFPDGLGLVAAAHGRGFAVAAVMPDDPPPTGPADRGPPAAARRLLRQIREGRPGRDMPTEDLSGKEWFTGKPDDGPGPNRPAAERSISGPIRGGPAAGNGDPALAFTAPVRPPGGGDPVGVLVGVLRLTNTMALIDARLGIGDPDRPTDSVVVVNARGQCVAHPRLAAAGLAPPPDGPAPPGFADLLAKVRPRLDAEGSADLTGDELDLKVWDPGDGAPHVAAAAFVPSPDVPTLGQWTVFVVRDPTVVSGAVTGLRRSLLQVEGVRLLVFAAGCGGLWGGLVWALRRRG